MHNEELRKRVKEIKAFQDVTYKDRILRFNHDTGEIDTSYCHWLNREETAKKYIKVTFDDDSYINFIIQYNTIIFINNLTF